MMREIKHGRRLSTRSSLLSTFLVVSLLTGCAGLPFRRGGEGEVKNSASWFSERELELGRQIHQQITSQFRIYTEPKLVGYVTEVASSLAKVADRQELDYLFTVLYDDRVYATNAPGGFVYITTGFLHFLQNEAELAAILAHELAWLQVRDVQFSLVRRSFNVLTQTVAIVAPFFGQIGALASLGFVLIHAATEGTVGSEEKRLKQADQRALRYLVEAGHDPQGYLDVIHRLSQPGPAWKPYLFDYMESRPLTEERHRGMMKAFEKLPLESKSFTVHRERYLEMTRGVREIYQH